MCAFTTIPLNFWSGKKISSAHLFSFLKHKDLFVCFAFSLKIFFTFFNSSKFREFWNGSTSAKCVGRTYVLFEWCFFYSQPWNTSTIRILWKNEMKLAKIKQIYTKTIRRYKIQIPKKTTKLIVECFHIENFRWKSSEKIEAQRVRTHTTVLKGYQISTVFTNVCAEIIFEIQTAHMLCLSKRSDSLSINETHIVFRSYMLLHTM